MPATSNRLHRSCGTEINSGPRLVKNHLPDGQYNALGDCIFRMISRREIYVKCLEVLPSRRSWIREPPVRERVAHEQVTVFVIDARFRNTNPRQQQRSTEKSERDNQDHCPPILR